MTVKNVMFSMATFSFVTQVRKCQLMKKMLEDSLLTAKTAGTCHILANLFNCKGPIDPVCIMLVITAVLEQ